MPGKVQCCCSKCGYYDDNGVFQGRKVSRQARAMHEKEDKLQKARETTRANMKESDTEDSDSEQSEYAAGPSGSHFNAAEQNCRRNMTLITHMVAMLGAWLNLARGGSQTTTGGILKGIAIILMTAFKIISTTLLKPLGLDIDIPRLPHTPHDIHSTYNALNIELTIIHTACSPKCFTLYLLRNNLPDHWPQKESRRACKASVSHPTLLLSTSKNCPPPVYEVKWSSFNIVMIPLGQVIAYRINAGFTNVGGGWRWMVGLGAVPAGLQFVFLFFLPESPRVLIRRGYLEAAKSIMGEIYVYAKPEEVDPKPTAVGLIVPGTNFIFTFVALKWIDQVSHRQIMVWSAPGMIFGLVLAAIAFHSSARCPYLDSQLTHKTPSLDLTQQTNGVLVNNTSYPQSWSAIILSMIIYVTFYATSLGNISWQQGEFFSLEYQGLSTSLSTMTNWAANFLIGSTYLSLMAKITPTGAFGSYASPPDSPKNQTFLSLFSKQEIPTSTKTAGLTLTSRLSEKPVYGPLLSLHRL
ncbi:hypothetical protein K435DRAFT_874053 [Dendrothele bispora CBS 962.96]|uniref:Uncharacterized protein n=1 Tax=Dendrothele bispora (strain CBS 962.96) TaxID=1314807 RepID=A0A4S8KXL2_DENBC|nr:hypothetical protein K435DRAFT_874053 [Dendrothele bispora CBS 962.96]